MEIVEQKSGLRHVRAYTYWRNNGRNIAATARALKLGEASIRAWREREDWVRLADEADAALAQKLEQQVEDSLTRHKKEMDGLLTMARAAINGQLVGVLRRYRTRSPEGIEASVDATEVKDIVQALSAFERTAANFYGTDAARELKVQHSGEVKTSSSLEALRARLGKILPGLLDEAEC